MSLREKIMEPDSNSGLSGLDEGREEKVGLQGVGKRSQGQNPEEYNRLTSRQRNRHYLIGWL